MDPLDYVINTLAEQHRYLCITRDEQILATQLAWLNEFKLAIESTKNEFIEAQNEEKANLWLSAEELCTAIACCVQMFLDLKANKPDFAWNRLVDAQDHAHWSCDKSHLLNGIPSEYVSYFNALEKILFPPQTFTSISVVASTKCGICDSPLPECDHIRGSAYMGMRCTEVITPISVDHVAIVDHPADKRCRITHRGDGEDKMVNLMTLLEEPTGGGPGVDFLKMIVD